MTTDIEQRVRAFIDGLEDTPPPPFQNFLEARAHVDLCAAQQGVAWWAFNEAEQRHGKGSWEAQIAYQDFCELSVPQAATVARMMMTPAARKKDVRLKRRFQSFFGGCAAWDAAIAADRARLARPEAGDGQS